MTEQRAGPGLDMGRDLPLVLRQTWQPALLPEMPAVYTHSSGMLFNRKKKGGKALFLPFEGRGDSYKAQLLQVWEDFTVRVQGQTSQADDSFSAVSVQNRSSCGSQQGTWTWGAADLGTTVEKRVELRLFLGLLK